jgi:hypothetical protein
MSRSTVTSSNQIIDEYFCWLCKIIQVEQKNKSYWILARRLFDRQFEWFVLNDDNRCEDGMWIRERFDFDLTDIYQEHCNMLEVLIALAERFDETVQKAGEQIATHRYFWEMMDNCGLSRYSDSWFSDNLEDYKRISGKIPGETGWDTCLIDRIIDKIINREYDRLGNGGLFPLRKSKKDQRKVELWYQLSEYINENYSIIDEKR